MPIIGIAGLAEPALKFSLTIMLTQVSVEVDFTSKRLSAKVALIKRLTRVGVLVLHQRRPICERSRAQVALMRPLTRVDAPVNLQVAQHCKAGRAQIAPIRSLASVRSQVLYKAVP